jgi:hypothetical protein
MINGILFSLYGTCRDKIRALTGLCLNYLKKMAQM